MRRVLVASLVLLGACGHHATTPSAPDMAFAGAFAKHDKVDILFMMDNSPGTSPKQNETVKRFPLFIQALDAAAAAGHPASYHIGVVDSDLGAGPETLDHGQCHPGGDNGVLQIAPAAGAVLPAGLNCTNLKLGDGVRFIEYDQIARTNNITGVADLSSAFACIAAVGPAGCGFEHVLESTYRALSGTVPENAGFLRIIRRRWMRWRRRLPRA